MARVVVVEDDPSLRDLVADVLESEGYDVATASDGQEGLELIRLERPAAIVTDLMMPRMEGWQMLDNCRGMDWCGEVPVVVMSATYDLPRTAEKLKDVGVKACVAKPFDLDALVALIERSVRHAA